MKKVELKARFNEFYNRSYHQAMAYCLANTGDFINAEDILAHAYYGVYKRILKDKRGAFTDSEKYLLSLLDQRILKYWKKHRKELVEPSVSGVTACDELLDMDLNLTPESVTKQMLMQDILEYVSGSPALMRRAFAMRFYLNYSLEETAEELGVSIEAASAYLSLMLQEIEENFLDD